MKQIKFQKYPFQRHILRDSFEVAQSAISCAARALFSIIPSIGSAGKPPRLVWRRTRTRHHTSIHMLGWRRAKLHQYWLPIDNQICELSAGCRKGCCRGKYESLNDRMSYEVNELPPSSSKQLIYVYRANRWKREDTRLEPVDNAVRESVSGCLSA